MSRITQLANVTPPLDTPHFRIRMLTHGNGRHGAQGQYDTASKGTLENEFGTKNEEDCIKAILEKGNLQDTEVGTPNPLPSRPWTVELSLQLYDVLTCYLRGRWTDDKAPRTTAWDREVPTR